MKEIKLLVWQPMENLPEPKTIFETYQSNDLCSLLVFYPSTTVIEEKDMEYLKLRTKKDILREFGDDSVWMLLPKNLDRISRMLAIMNRKKHTIELIEVKDYLPSLKARCLSCRSHNSGFLIERRGMFASDKIVEYSSQTENYSIINAKTADYYGSIIRFIPIPETPEKRIFM